MDYTSLVDLLSKDITDNIISITEATNVLDALVLKEGIEDAKLYNYLGATTNKNRLLVRSMELLKKKKSEGKISEDEYNREVEKLKEKGKTEDDERIDPESISNYNVHNGKRELPNRSERKAKNIQPTQNKVVKRSIDRQGSIEISDPSEIQDFKRMIDQLASTDNMGEYKSYFNSICKKAGLDSSLPFSCSVIRGNTLRFRQAITKNALSQKNIDTDKIDQLVHLSNSNSLKYLRPTNKSRDGVFYPDLRIYFSVNPDVALKEMPEIQKNKLTQYSITDRDKINQAKNDPESHSGKSVFIRTKYPIKAKNDGPVK